MRLVHLFATTTTEHNPLLMLILLITSLALLPLPASSGGDLASEAAQSRQRFSPRPGPNQPLQRVRAEDALQVLGPDPSQQPRQPYRSQAATTDSQRPGQAGWAQLGSNQWAPPSVSDASRALTKRQSGADLFKPQARSGRLERPRRTSEDVCSDRLCYGLPHGCLDQAPQSAADLSRKETGGSLCSVLVTSKHLIDPYRPVARDIHFELVALPIGDQSNYAAVGFSETGRMAGLVSECLEYRDEKTQLRIIKLAHSYNLPGQYRNVPVSILSGIRNLGVSFEDGYFQCRWVVESAVEFTYEDSSNGTLVNKREDLGYKNYHVLLASGEYDPNKNLKGFHTSRVSSASPISLAQTGHLKSLGSHILVRIHGSLMITIWVGLVTLSVILARYYKNEWANSKINELAIWFVLHRSLMLIAWFGTIIAIIFAYVYTETYHPGLHQISGSLCLALATVQVLGGLLRPSVESNKRPYFNWAHFVCGNLSYLFAMVSIITAAYLAPAHLPPLYIWVVAAFVATYALTHFTMTVHQYIVHKSSKISITPMSDLNDSNSRSSATYSSCGFVADSYPKETNSTFRQVMLGILVTLVVIFIVLLISLVNLKQL